VSCEISSRKISKKSFSCVLCAFSRVFYSRFAGENVFLDGFLVVFTVVRPRVAFSPPPFLQALQGTHHVSICFLYSLLYQMK